LVPVSAMARHPREHIFRPVFNVTLFKSRKKAFKIGCELIEPLPPKKNYGN